MTLPPLAIQVLLILVAVTAAMIDVRTRKVPNWLSLAGVLLAILLNSFLYAVDGIFSAEGLLFSLKGLGLAFGIYFVLYLLRGMGAGDVKLMAAIGAAVGWANWLGILVMTSAAGLIAGIVLVFAKRRVRETLHNMETIVTALPKGRAPYKENPDLDVRS
ncbi:MAG: A24 family peptidase, partial [Bryobacteraceae bacterium]